MSPAEESEVDQDALIDDAWRILRELMETGKAKLKSGQEITAADPLVGVVEKVARLKKPVDRRMAEVEGFRVAPTAAKTQAKAS